MKYYSYEDFRIDTKKLLLDVKEFKPQAIVGIARGGLTLAHALAEGMDTREVQTLRTELYDKTLKREKISIFGDCDFSEISRVLVVDDISDSGDTLKAVISYLISKHNDIEFKASTLFYKKTSIYEPNFWVNEADDWIDFFWERDFKVN